MPILLDSISILVHYPREYDLTESIDISIREWLQPAKLANSNWLSVQPFLGYNEAKKQEKIVNWVKESSIFYVVKSNNVFVDYYTIWFNLATRPGSAHLLTTFEIPMGTFSQFSAAGARSDFLGRILKAYEGEGLPIKQVKTKSSSFKAHNLAPNFLDIGQLDLNERPFNGFFEIVSNDGATRIPLSKLNLNSFKLSRPYPWRLVWHRIAKAHALRPNSTCFDEILWG